MIGHNTAFFYHSRVTEVGYKKVLSRTLSHLRQHLFVPNPGTSWMRYFSDVVVQYPKFMGTGYVAFPVLRGAYKEFTVTVEFRPDTHNGLLVFSSEHPNARSDFFSISLVDGRAEFR